MSSDFESHLMEALDALSAGERLEDVLAHYPAGANELRPALEIYTALAGGRVAAGRQAQADSRRDFLAEAERLRAQPFGGRSAWSLLRRALSTAAAVAFVLFLLGSVLVIASAATLPGDAFYSLKTTVQQVRLTLSGDPAAFRQDLAALRMAELEEMLATGREGLLELLGFVEALDQDKLTLNGRELDIDGAAGVDLVAVGDEVAALIAVNNGAVTVVEITLLVPAELPLLVTPQATPTPTATPTSTANPTATATMTPTPSPSTTATATATATTTDTPISSATQTETPTTTITRFTTETPSPTPTNIHDFDDGDDDDDNSGPGDGDDDDDNSGPGDGDDDDDNSGPGDGDDDDDNSGPGNGDDSPES